MTTPLSDAALDAILALQFTVAWAGEGRSSPPRLGWWDTDLISEDGGGDFFARLLPHTHAWAALEAVREAARRTDAKARAKAADQDALRSLFFLGFDTDEQLAERLAALKRSGRPPAEALVLALPLSDEFSPAALEPVLHAADAAFDSVPHGRALRGNPPDEPELMVKRLAAALLPLAEHYPLPFYRGRDAS